MANETSSTKLVALTSEQIATIEAALATARDASDQFDFKASADDAKRAIYYTRDPVEMANGILQREYEQVISDIVYEAKAKIADLDDDEITCTDDLETWLHESIDGHEFVIYTYRNFQVLRYSSNDGAYVEDFGAEDLAKEGGVNWPALTYCAMLADVRDELGDVDELLAAREEAAEAREVTS